LKIVVIGTRYVGLLTWTCFVEVGIDLICVDIVHKKNENLNKGIIPIFN
jgi:UDPglucose 6-dehydrogenase